MGIQMMSNLICRKTFDFSTPHLTVRASRSCATRPCLPEPQEPIPVRVRIRQHSDYLSSALGVRSATPDLGRLPVGTTLDCYV
jgi:hypothetical protein